MFREMSTAQKVILGITAAVAVVGWVFAFYARSEVASAVDNLAQAREALRQHQQANEELDELIVRIDQSKSDLALLTPQAGEIRAELDRLRSEVQEQQALASGTALKFRTTAEAMIRAEPSLDGQEVAVVPEGNTLEVLEIVEDGNWYRVGGMGFVFHEQLEPVAPANNP